MYWLREFFLRLHAVLRSNRIDREIDEEMRFHLEMRSQEYIEAGMRPEDARREAMRRFGNITYIKEISRDVRGGGMLETLLQDLRYGARMLLKQPIFTAAAVITLALGIGATTTVFSIVDAVLLRPLPFKEPERLVSVWEINQQQEKDAQASSTGNFVDWQNQNQVFEDMAAYFNWNTNLIGVDDPERLNSAIVTGSFFQVLGVSAKIGRVLLPSDDRPGNDEVVLLSHGLWQRRFGADPEIVGKKLTLSGGSFTIVGVMPPDCRFPDKEVELWMPAGFSAKQSQDRRGKFIKVIARLKPGIKLDQAQAEMKAIAAQLEQQFPDTNTGWEVKVASLDSAGMENVRLALFVLLGAVGFVLLIACVNVANLLLARAAARRREFAIRVALGAGRMRLINQMLTEGLLLAMLGGLIGVLLAYWGVSIITHLNPGDIPRIDEIGINRRVLGFTLATCAMSVMIFGLVPALFASSSAPQESLKAEGRSMDGGPRRRLRNALVVSEIAVALILLIGAGLMIKSFWRLQSVSPGFKSDNLLTMRIWLSASRYAENHRQITFFQQLIDRIERVPGVQSVGAIQDLPIRRNRMGFDFVIEGRPIPSSGDKSDAAYRVVTPDYFATMGIPLLGGRQFTNEDNQQAAQVIIINQSFARQLWPDGDPLGKRIRFGGEDKPWCAIIGVVGDVKHMGLDVDEGPAIYQPHAQKPEFLRWMTIVARTNVEPLSLVSAVRSQVQALDKDQPIYDIVTMERLLSQSVANPRFYMVLLGVFAFISLALAAVGVYGLLAFWVTQRTKEIGIHLALGAQQNDVMRIVMGKGFKLTLSGIGLGLAGAFILTQVMQSLLYGVSTTDPITYLGLSLVLMSVGVLACYIPARRATRVDPMIALRYE
ncbi:MAG TPA: ABC transporter permease [Blastocatellia bacterium]|jgi:putative ABC transport system permease protein|nr:ABC transporter permease [Blastocatellia bacterium]